MDPLVVYDGDDKPTVWLQILNDDGLIDLSAATTVITWKFRLEGATTDQATGTCSKVKGGGVTGWVQLDWGATDLDELPAGNYEIEVTVSFDGSLHTVNYFYEVGVEGDWNNNVLPVLAKGDF